MLAGLPLISKEEEKDDSIVMKSFCHKHGPRFCFRGRWVVDPKKTFVEQSDVLDASLPAVDTVQQLLTSVFDHERSPTRPSFYKVHRFFSHFFSRQRVDAVQLRAVAGIYWRLFQLNLRLIANTKLEEAESCHRFLPGRRVLRALLCQQVSPPPPGNASPLRASNTTEFSHVTHHNPKPLQFSHSVRPLYVDRRLPRDMSFKGPKPEVGFHVFRGCPYPGLHLHLRAAHAPPPPPPTAAARRFTGSQGRAGKTG
jgi:hypothetical protein